MLSFGNAIIQGNLICTPVTVFSLAPNISVNQVACCDDNGLCENDRILSPFKLLFTNLSHMQEMCLFVFIETRQNHTHDTDYKLTLLVGLNKMAESFY